MLPIKQLQQLFLCLQHHFDLSRLEEVTLECNPEDLDDTYLDGLKDMRFVNRLSIGVQSLDNTVLKRFNRRHDAETAIESIERAHKHGFDNISIDLIYAVPRGTLMRWATTLKRLKPIAEFIQHLSCYSLSIENGTMLERQMLSTKMVPATEEEVLQQYHTLQHWAKKNGFCQYEISNFCKAGYESKHNSRYWNRTPYLGVGAAAHSFNGSQRRWNIADSSQYIEGIISEHPLFEEENLTNIDAFNEYVMTALRTTQGLDKQMLSTFEIPNELFSQQFCPSLQKQMLLQMLTETPTHYVPTPKGLLQADGIAINLMVSE